MATILSSKTFFIPKTAGIPLDYISEWFQSVNRNTDDCRLTVTLQRLGVFRHDKTAAKKELESLIAHAVAVSHTVWRKGGYRFNFLKKEFTWKGNEIHLTANEQLFLFRWLMLHDETHKQQRFYLWNMRKRLGLEFLAGISEDKK